MSFRTFQDKWSTIKKDKAGAILEEKSLFVDIGEEPRTQRQLNLYYYFIFIKNIIESGEYKNVLEIGCGRGTLSLYLKKYLEKSVTLVDNAEGAISVAKDEFVRRGLDADFYIADALNTDLPEQSFDVIISIGLAEHLDNVDDLFKEQYRLLRPGGIMISLNIPKKFSVQYLNNIMRSIKKIFGKYNDSIRKDYYRNSFTPEEYKSFAHQVGFEHTETVNVSPFPIYTPIEMSTDRTITKINKIILEIKKLWSKYPYKTNRLLSQAHFLVGRKK